MLSQISGQDKNAGRWTQRPLEPLCVFAVVLAIYLDAELQASTVVIT